MILGRLIVHRFDRSLERAELVAAPLVVALVVPEEQLVARLVRFRPSVLQTSTLGYRRRPVVRYLAVVVPQEEALVLVVARPVVRLAALVER